MNYHLKHDNSRLIKLNSRLKRWPIFIVFIVSLSIVFAVSRFPILQARQHHEVSRGYFLTSLSFRDISSFDTLLVHFKSQTCFVLSGLISAIWSFHKIPLKLNELKKKLPLPPDKWEAWGASASCRSRSFLTYFFL